MNKYHEALQREFAKYGFAGCPLTDEQITDLYQRNISIQQAYTIGCDTNSGFTYTDLLGELS